LADLDELVQQAVRAAPAGWAEQNARRSEWLGPWLSLPAYWKWCVVLQRQAFRWILAFRMGGRDRGRLALQFLPAGVFDASPAAWQSLRRLDGHRGNMNLLVSIATLGESANAWRALR